MSVPSEDATAVLLNLKTHIVAPGMDKHVLEERRQQARCACRVRPPRAYVAADANGARLPRSPDQITRELDTYELMQLLDYGGGDTFDGALFAAASQGADRCALGERASPALHN